MSYSWRSYSRRPYSWRRLAGGLVTALLVGGTGQVVATAAPTLSARFEPTGGCVDAPLRLTFSSPPTLGTAGTVQIHAADGTVVDDIDLADPNSARRTIGDAVSDTGVGHLFNYYPVIISGDTATIYPHHELGYRQAYYVTISPEVFPGYPGITRPWAWPVRTRALPPRPGTRELTVSAGGAGDFCTVQGAIDGVPEGNRRPVTITVRPGVYTEIDYVRADRADITVRGTDRDSTIIQYPNNDKLNGDAALDKTDPANACPLRVLPVPDLTNCWRAVFGVDAPDFTLSDITVRNTTPYGGSQAEAFRGNNQHITLNRVALDSFQDTLRLQGTGFVTNSYVQGDVDFIWGTGSVFVQDSELKAIHAGYYTQIRNDANHDGDVFVADRLTEDAGVPAGSVYLGRIQLSRFPDSQAEYVDDAMGPQVAPAGWLLTPGFGDCGQAQNLRYGEYRSTDLAGNPVDTSQRLPCASQLSAAEAVELRDPANVLSGWVPATINATETRLRGRSDNTTVGGQGYSVNWSAPVGHAATDRVVLFRLVGPVPIPLFAIPVGSTATTGTLRVDLPALPGRYEVGYLPAGATRPAATSALLTMGAGGGGG